MTDAKNVKRLRMIEKEAAILQFVKLCQREGGARRSDLPCASRQEDKVRQAARKRGLVVFEDRGDGCRWFAVGGNNIATEDDLIWQLRTNANCSGSEARAALAELTGDQP